MFSKACEYAIRAVVCLAACGSEGQRMRLQEIAAGIGSPEAFTAKIMQQLVHAGLVMSVKGPGGGFEISLESARKITLSQIVATIDGDDIYTGCALGLPHCNAQKPCPVHDHFLRVREDLRRMLEGTTLHELVTGVTKGRTYLKR